MPKRRPPRHACLECDRPALYRIRGTVRADRFHTLCARCYGRLVDQNRPK